MCLYATHWHQSLDGRCRIQDNVQGREHKQCLEKIYRTDVLNDVTIGMCPITCSFYCVLGVNDEQACSQQRGWVLPVVASRTS